MAKPVAPPAELRVCIDRISSFIDSLSEGSNNDCVFNSVKIVFDDTISPLISMLTTLARHINEMQGMEGSESVVFSISQLRGVYTALEVVWSWGLYPMLSEIVKRPREMHPKVMVISEENMRCRSEELVASCSGTSIGEWRGNAIMRMLSVLTEVSFSPPFRAMMAARNETRVFCVCIAVLSGESDISFLEEHKQVATRFFSEALLSGGVFNDRKEVVHALRYSAAVGSARMRTLAGEGLTAVLMQEDGLRVMLSVYLDGVSDGSDATGCVIRLARLLTSVPASLPSFLSITPSPENVGCVYFENISSQITSLLLQLHESKTVQPVYISACVLIVHRVCFLAADTACMYIMRKLFAPLLAVQDKDVRIPAADMERRFSLAVEVLHSMVTLHPLHTSVVQCLHKSGVLSASLSATVHILSSYPLCGLKHQLINICKEILPRTESRSAINLVENLIVHKQPAAYSAGETGGLIVVPPSSEKVGDKSSLGISALLGGLGVSSPAGEEGDGYEAIVQAAALSYASSALDTDETAANDMAMFNEIQGVISRAKGMAALFLSIFHTEGETSGEEKVTPEQDQQEDDSIPSGLFLRVLRGYLGMQSEQPDVENDTLLPPHISGMILLVLKSHLPLDMLLRNGHDILLVLAAFLEARARRISEGQMLMPSLDMKTGTSTNIKSSLIEELGSLSGVESDVQKGEEDTETETVTTVLALIGGMLRMGAQRRPDREEKILRDSMLPALQVMAGEDRECEVSQSAADVALIIMIRHAPEEAGDSEKNVTENDHMEGGSAFLRVCSKAKREYLYDSSAAMRGLGLRNIIVALREPAEALSHEDIAEAKEILLHLLKDEDSFVYLNVMHGISHLIDQDRRSLYPDILAVFTGEASTPAVSVRHRAALGESLSRALRRAGESSPVYVPGTVAACIPLCRRRVNLSQHNVSVNVNLTTMRVSSTDGTDVSEEALELAAREADEVFLRQTAFSLLAECIAVAGWSAAKHMRDVIDLAVGALTLEGSGQQESVAVRRSAAFLLRYTLQGLKDKIFQIKDAGLHLKDIYRILKVACRDRDRVVEFQASAALGVLSGLMKEQLFFSERQLSGEDLPPIRILN
mmetsp:Transcript_16477/g.24799  ORF Transcript_16477/g.24799 Transcript_16477/m.24799 type:complete len:1102 (-) Transcript_16477:57-3362(-)